MMLRNKRELMKLLCIHAFEGAKQHWSEEEDSAFWDILERDLCEYLMILKISGYYISKALYYMIDDNHVPSMEPSLFAESFIENLGFLVVV